MVEPLVYRGTTGLSSVALIAAATFWTWLWGPVGLLLSTPMTVCLVVLGRHVPQLQFLDVILGNEPVLTSEETFYQRILANDPEEATEQAEEFAKERSLADFFDEVVIPALVRAQADSDRGVLAPDSRTTFKEGIRTLLENLSEDEKDDDSPAGIDWPAATRARSRDRLRRRPERSRRSRSVVAGAFVASGASHRNRAAAFIGCSVVRRLQICRC